MLGAAAIAALAAVRPERRPGAVLWAACVVAAAALAGAGAGSLRVDSIDSGALHGRAGAEVRLSGQIASTPRREPSGVTAELEADEGRVLLSAPDLEGLEVGQKVNVSGRLAEPPPWRAGTLRRHGIAAVLEVDRIESTGERRGGLPGRIDLVRGRAEDALGRGMPQREAALARGFVLGQDDAIDARTREDFRRSGLAHLLAVSGQNVILLCLLAWPLLALAGLSLRARLGVLLVLIGIYVPVTGAGASIQRAGVMGAAGLVAALAGRPSSRIYALLLAAVVTLALNPRACGDVGWQLSFAAVIGIFAWTARLASALDGGARAGSLRRSLAEGAAMTVAATLATAPLMAHHFAALAPAALPANLLALPAVAPAMWLGMLASMAGQLPAIPVEPLNWLDSLCLAYIGQVARWLGSPAWAQLDLELASPASVAAAYVALGAAVELSLAAERRRRQAAGGADRPRLRPRRAVLALAALGFGAVAAGVLAPGDGTGPVEAGRFPPDRPRRRPGGRDPARAARWRPGARRRRTAGSRHGRRAAPARRRAAGGAAGDPRRFRSRRSRAGGARLAAGRPTRARVDPRPLSPQQRPRRAPSRSPSPRGASCAPASCASRCCGRRASSRRRSPRRQSRRRARRMRTRSWCSRNGVTSRCF